VENIGSSVIEHEEKMRVLDMQLSHLARIKEQLLELDIALRSCKINLSSYHKFCQVQISGLNVRKYALILFQKGCVKPQCFIPLSQVLFMQVRVIEVLWSMRNNNIVNQEVNQDNQCIDDSQCVTLGSTRLDLRKKCVSAISNRRK